MAQNTFSARSTPGDARAVRTDDPWKLQYNVGGDAFANVVNHQLSRLRITADQHSPPDIAITHPSCRWSY